MSTLKTLSQFYFGHTVTVNNSALDFKEGAGPELNGNLRVGSYSLTEFASEFQRALREAGTQAYGVSVNRTTRVLTVTAPSAFTLLASTGSRIGSGVFALAGFNATDVTGTSVSGQNASGKIYRPQYLLKNYTALEHNPLKESASVQISANGVVQVLSFGEGNRVKMNMVCITNKTGMKTSPFFENADGIDDALEFLNYLITKAKVEFMPDVATPSAFSKLLLDSTKADRNGTSFELKNMGVPDFYESGDLVFRKVIA